MFVAGQSNEERRRRPEHDTRIRSAISAVAGGDQGRGHAGRQDVPTGRRALAVLLDVELRPAGGRGRGRGRGGSAQGLVGRQARRAARPQQGLAAAPRAAPPAALLAGLHLAAAQEPHRSGMQRIY